ncbi:MAG: YceI family protein [Bacteroidetes bacterium]|nr:YceI family protein [Bacteroidota bacterium]
MKRAFLFLSALSMLAAMPADKPAKIYVFESGQIGFFSETPVENIEAHTNTYASVMNVESRKFAFSVQVVSFDFEKKLMQEHFNENYMESEKFPNATFKGGIEEEVNLFKDGIYQVMAKGELEIHGVTKERSIPVKIEVKGGKIYFKSDFQVKLVDHNIEVPNIVVANIAEVINVKVEGILKPKQ